MYKIYTDGSCKGNGKKDAVGAFAYVIIGEGEDGEEIIAEYADAYRNTTNNRMEMMAVIKALEKLEIITSLEEEKETLFANSAIFTDSAYIHNCLKQKWYVNWQENGWVNSSKQPVKNKDLWERIIPYFNKINFYKVKGHAGDKWNEYVDNLAQSQAKNYSLNLEEVYL